MGDRVFQGWYFTFIVFLLAACTQGQEAPNVHGQAPDWSLVKRLNHITKVSYCMLASSPRALASGLGMDEIRILVAKDGRVMLTSSSEPFDMTALHQMGIRIDGNTPFLAPTPRSPTELSYSASVSEALLLQMKSGKSARIQIALMPRRELLTGIYSLQNFEPALTTYRMCEVLRAEEIVPKSALQEQ
jgi:hypothetical protein